MSFNFLFWNITVEPRKPSLSPFELTMYDQRWWSMDAFSARFWRRYGKTPSTTAIKTPAETPLRALETIKGTIAETRQSVTKTHRARLSGGLGVCAYCGKSFVGRKDAKYCSPAHRQKAWKETKKAAQLATA